MEASIILNCSDYSKNIIDILKIFQQIGWDIYNAQGKVEYLPIGDDECDWQCEKISKIKLYDIVSKKIDKKEQIGVNLFYNNGDGEGVSFLADTTDQILLSISINRKIVKGKNTDMVWYLENIVYKFLNIGVRLLSYKLEEYED